jgi:hypothetical protein
MPNAYSNCKPVNSYIANSKYTNFIRFITFCLVHPPKSISDVSADTPLVAFYDIRGRNGNVLFFFSVPDTTRDHVCTNMHYAIFMNEVTPPLLASGFSKTYK